jgi:HEAT repeat protein
MPPGLPTQPTSPGQSGGSFHTWLTWWGYNQFKYLDYKNRQNARRGPVSGPGAAFAAKKRKDEDPNAWRKGVRATYTELMLEALADEDEEARTAAAVALGKWRVKGAIDKLKRMRTHDTIKQVRESALLGLILMRDPALRDHLIGIARDPDELPRMRGFALLGLGMTGDKDAVEYVFKLLDPKSKAERARYPANRKVMRELRCAAIAGVAYKPNPKLGDRLMSVARNERVDEEVRAYALAAVGKVGDTSQLGRLVEVLKRDKVPQLRRSAAIALGRLGTRGDADAMEALRHALKYDRDRIVGHFATLSLGQIGGPLAFTFLSEAYPKANKEARGFFAIAFGLCKERGAEPLLLKMLTTSKDARDRAAAALALGLGENPAHAPALREAFADAKDWMLMQTTMISLGILDDKRSADPIKDVLITRRQPAVRTSAALSYALLQQWSAVPLFTDLLKSARSIVTLSALSQVMGFLASPKAVAPLVGLYKDKKLQRQARAFALVALGALGDPEPLPILVRLAFDTNYMVRSDAVDEAVTIL